MAEFALIAFLVYICINIPSFTVIRADTQLRILIGVLAVPVSLVVAYFMTKG